MSKTNGAHAAVDSQFLLTDTQIEKFVIDGYLLVQTDLPAEFHTSVCQQIDAVFAKEGNPGDNILARVPDLHKVYDNPPVRGALVSILGPDFAMNGHRHCHFMAPGHRSGHWHQDGINHRHHQIRTVLGMYYPQDVTEEMGPTVILPGTQYHNTPSTRMASYMNFRSQVVMLMKAGTVAITHYDIWHAWLPNKSNQNRRMLKFLFDRKSEPVAPTWNASPDYKFNPNPFLLPFDGQSSAYKHRVMWRGVWDWLHGIPPEPGVAKW